MALLPTHDSSWPQPRIRPIAPPVLFTPRERLRLILIRWLYANGRLTD